MLLDLVLELEKARCMQRKILMIGYGAMGSALAVAWRKQFKLTIIDPAHPNCLNSMDDVGINYRPEIIVIAVKPQILPRIIKDYATRFDDPETKWVSIAAGVPLSFIRQYLKKGQTLIRVMPNLPVRFQKGMNALISDKGRPAIAEELFSFTGEIIWLDDELEIDAVTAIAGSGPAYFYLMTEELAKAAIQLGLSAEIANLLARQTAIGAGATLEHMAESPITLRQQVTSPSGTTAAALSVLMAMDSNLGELLKKATKAAKDRSIELGRGK